MARSQAAAVLCAVLGACAVGCARHGDDGASLLAADSGVTPEPELEEGLEGEHDRGFLGVILAGETLELEANVEGRVLEILVKPGDEVARDTPIATLDVSAARHELAMARAALGRASRQLARRMPLARRGLGAVTPEELDGVRTEVVAQRAKVAQLAQLVAAARVVAPFDGTVAARYLSTGALAGPGRPLIRLNGRGHPKVRFAIPEALAREAVAGAKVTVTIQPPGTEVDGTVVTVSPEVDVSTRMIYATADLAAPSEQRTGLMTGLIARVFMGPGSDGRRQRTERDYRFTSGH